MNSLRWLKRKDGEMILQHSVYVSRFEKNDLDKWQDVGCYEWRDVPIEEDI